MRFSKFEITNFRGIQSATLDLSRVPNEAVNVLVGLNESGKTTVRSNQSFSIKSKPETP